VHLLATDILLIGRNRELCFQLWSWTPYWYL